jgi:monovalent cation/hydrogen antiporter
MEHLELLIPGLMIAVAALSVLAGVLDIPYPILLVVGGLGLGFMPGVPEVKLEPDLVLALFLPPLLYSAAFFANLRDLKRDLRSISTLSIGLVLATTVTVALVAHALVPAMPWAAAFALGAVVSPTDPLAATTVARRVGAPRRFVNVIEGESLVNDGTALVAYRVAVAAAIGQGFSLLDAGIRFVGGAAGGIAIGLVVGFLITEVRRRIEDPPVEITISLFTGYAAFLPAEQLGLSGVLAAVTAGIYLGWLAPEISSANMRMQGFAVWSTLIFLLNAVLFVLIGLQMPTIVDGLDGFSTGEVAGYAAAVCAVVIATRIAWVFVITGIIRTLDRRESQRARRTPAAQLFLTGWAGMRGAVSLAAALAIPLETDAGAAFPNRDLIIFLTFAVIFVTLVVQGLSLPWLIRRLGIQDDGEEDREELRARLTAAAAALERLDELAEADWTRDDTVERMRGMYDYRRRRFKARAGKIEDDGYEDRSQAYQRLVRELIVAQRAAVVGLRNEGGISNDVMHRIERELDLEETRLEDQPG